MDEIMKNLNMEMNELMKHFNMEKEKVKMDEIMKQFNMESEEEKVKSEIEKAKQSEAWNNQAPQSRPHKERIFELIRFESLVEGDAAKNQEQGKVAFKKTWVTGKSHCSKKDWNELKPINLRQMKVPMVHGGSFLACRIIANPNVCVGTSVLIEDTKGDVEDLTFYNFTTNLNNPNWVKKGQIMLVKEPYLKYASMAKSAFIRVESPSDVLFVNETDKAILEKANALCWYKRERLSFDELKAMGNVQFSKGNYEEAIHFYQRALNKCQNEIESGTIHSNLSAALLHLDRFYEAHEEATKALKENGEALREKLLFRLSKSVYGMRQWDKAIEYSSTIVKEFPENIKGIEELEKAKARQREASTGEYDIQGMIEQAKRGDLLMDKADYIGPIRVAEIQGKGKGLIATKKIKKGTLLLAEKAYALCTRNDDNQFLMCINLLTNEMNMGHQYLSMVETVQKLKRNPQTAKNLYGLFAGNEATDRDEYCKTMIKKDLIDSARIERIYSYNAFAARQIMDEGEINENVNTNTLKSSASDNLNESPSGLWLMPSFANHSCLGNAYRVFYGDMLFLYSICEIGEGDEITTHYCNPSLTKFDERKKKLKKWGFECKCEMCVLDGNDHRMEQKRENLLKMYKDIRVKALNETATKWFKPILNLVEKMRETYKNRAKFRIHLILPLMTLRHLYLAMGEPTKAIEVCKEAIEALGEPLVYFHQPQLNLVMAEIYAFGLNPPNIRMAKKIAREAYEMTKIRTGIKNEELFHQIYKNYPRIL